MKLLERATVPSSPEHRNPVIDDYYLFQFVSGTKMIVASGESLAGY